jgi:hypothetical protein
MKLQLMSKRQLARIIEDENRIRVIFKDGTMRESNIESNATLVQQLC